MEKEKRRWVSRLLAVCMCMTVVLMGIQMVPSASAKGGGGGVVFYHYYGDDVRIYGGTNYITPCAIPKVPTTNATMSAQYWAEHFRALNGTVMPNAIRAIEWYAFNGGIYTWDNTHKTYGPLGAFDICQGGSNYGYYVYSLIAGWLPMNGGANGWSFTPKTMRLNLPSGSIDAYVGPFNQYQPPGGPPPPADPPWDYHASQYRQYLYTSTKNPYTGNFVLNMWNETTMSFMTYDSTNPATDFIAYSNTWGLVGLHRCVILTLPTAGLFWWTGTGVP